MSYLVDHDLALLFANDKDSQFEPLETQYKVLREKKADDDDDSGGGPEFIVVSIQGRHQCESADVLFVASDEDSKSDADADADVVLHVPNGRVSLAIAYDYIFNKRRWNPKYVFWGLEPTETMLNLLSDTRSIGLISPYWSGSSSQDLYIARLCSIYKFPYHNSPIQTFESLAIKSEVLKLTFKLLPPTIFYLVQNETRLEQIIQRWILAVNHAMSFRHQRLAPQMPQSPQSQPYVAIMAAHITSQCILQLTYHNVSLINKLPGIVSHIIVVSFDPPVKQEDIIQLLTSSSEHAVVVFVKNHPVTRDFDKWRQGYEWWRQNTSSTPGTQFILHNDSYILTRPPYEMILQHEPRHVTGIILSHQINDHVQSYLRILPDSVMPELCENVSTFRGKTVNDLIRTFEVFYFDPSCLSFVYQAQLRATNPTNDDCELHRLITQLDFPIIKRKALFDATGQTVRPYLVPHIPTFFLMDILSTEKTHTQTHRQQKRRSHGIRSESAVIFRRLDKSRR